MIQIHPVKTKEAIQVVAELAHTIWYEHYTPIIGKEQVDYMVPKFQSVEAITTQIEDAGYSYFLLRYEKEPAGYIGLQESEKGIYLSKLYIRKEYRGQGIGAAAFRIAEDFAKANNRDKIWLTVNRDNKDTIEVYLRKGFEKVREEKADIGNGFVMDDYIMEKVI